MKNRKKNIFYEVRFYAKQTLKMSENNASPTSSGNSSSESSSVTPSNEHKTQLSESKTRRKSFVRCKSIDLDDSFNLYRSITNTPRSDSQSYSNEIAEKPGEKGCKTYIWKIVWKTPKTELFWYFDPDACI